MHYTNKLMRKKSIFGLFFWKSNISVIVFFIFNNSDWKVSPPTREQSVGSTVRYFVRIRIWFSAGSDPVLFWTPKAENRIRISDKICDDRTVLQYFSLRSNNNYLKKTNKAVVLSGSVSSFIFGSDPDPELCEGALT